MVTELQTMVADGARPDEVLEAALEKSGYLAELEASSDPQDESRVENLVSCSPWPASSPTNATRPPSASSSSGSRWWPTPTRSPTRTSPAGWSP